MSWTWRVRSVAAGNSAQFESRGQLRRKWETSDRTETRNLRPRNLGAWRGAGAVGRARIASWLGRARAR